MSIFSNIKQYSSTNNCITNVFRSSSDYTGNDLYKKCDNRTFNKTENVTKHINNYSYGITNNYIVKDKQCKGNVS